MASHVTQQLAGPDPTRHLGQWSWTTQVALTRDQLGRARRWLIVAGSLALLVGVVSIAVPVIASVTVTLTFVLAVWFFASGVLSLAYALQWRGVPGWWLSALGGVCSVILGFLIAASLPSSAAWAIGLLVGINLVFWGVRALVSARLLKELAEPAGRT